jgi:chromosome segregation ATPase
MAEREITLTAIYELIQGQSNRMEGMDQRFDRMDENFNRMDEKFGQMNEKFDRIDEKFNRIDEKFDRIDEKFNRIDEKFDRMDNRLERMESVQNSIALRLISVETTVKEHSAILAAMQTRLDALHGLVEELERRTGRIEQEYVMITEALRRLEIRFDQMEAERLKERIAALEARVQALETART